MNKFMLQYSTDSETVELLELLASRSPQLTPGKLISYLLKEELKRCIEFDNVLKEKYEELKVRRENEKTI